MITRALHNSWLSEYRDPFGAAVVGSVVHIAIDIWTYQDTDVQLRIRREGSEQQLTYMSYDGCFDEKKSFSIDVTMPETGTLLWYDFIIRQGDSTYYYGNNNQALGGEGMLLDCEPIPYQITVYKATLVPEWYKGGIAYQIFPDRFARDDDWKIRTEFAIENRNRNLNIEDSQKQFIEEDWHKPAYYVKDDDGNVIEWPFYGGSLKGIEEKLDYLKSFGVSVIYLNPIFKAVSNHRYDTADYMSVDPILGTDEDFRSLCASARKRGLSIILDGVFSHTGADSVYFDKYSNYGGTGAYSNEQSLYRYWYKFDETEECGYKAWWGVRDLPEVDENNAFYRQMICGENGVLKKWLKAGARGWRLDVADELPDNFIRDIRNTIKGEDKDNILLGEVWEDASNKISYDVRRKYLLGDELDSTMNYPLRQILLDYVNYTISSREATRRIMNLKENYPREYFYSAFNMLGSHDRKRILSLMAAEENYDAASRKVKLLSTLQYTLPGVPCIYYGDEIGMMGNDDPENRSAFAWGKENLDMSYHFRMLGLIYKDHPVLRDGELDFINDGINDDVIAFIRSNNQERILVLVNRSFGDTEVDLSEIAECKTAYALELLSSTELELGRIKLDKLSSAIILLKDEIPGDRFHRREAGVICHISSIPGSILGAPARNFVDWLSETGMKIWQILPLNPTGLGDCPYNSCSAFAGNPDFINYSELPNSDGYEKFCLDNAVWLKEYLDYKLSQPKYIDCSEVEKTGHKKTLLKEQYYFDCQWKELKKYANSKGIRIMGDLPMFVSADSADVKYNPDIFLLDEDGRLSVNAGVPPDDFSDEGQNWGSALYDWDALKASDYNWWMRRLKQCAERYDILRLDHFRAFSEYYSIPFGKSPKEGHWHYGPGIDFFNRLNKELKESGLELEIIAEDLGLLDAGVFNLVKLTGYSGMNIWQFSADEMMDADPEYAEKRVYYSGTHDNQTLLGWIVSNNPDTAIEDAMEYACETIAKIFYSPAKYAIVQLQDMFLLDDSARMNVPGIPEGNWKWRISTDELKCSEEVARWYRELISSSNR